MGLVSDYRKRAMKRRQTQRARTTVAAVALCLLTGCAAPNESRHSTQPPSTGPIENSSTIATTTESSPPEETPVLTSSPVEVDGLPCFDAPWMELVQTDCDGDAYLLTGASTGFDAPWCGAPRGYPMRAVAVSSSSGVLCFLHLDPPRPVADAAAFGAVTGRCLAGGRLLPITVSCNQQFSVLVSAVSSSEAQCPAPRLRGVLAWSVPDQNGQVVCLQRYVAKDPISPVVPVSGPPWPASLVIPAEVMRETNPVHAGLDYAPPSWTSPGAPYSVMCADGTVSSAGGRQGACSWHGGVG